MSELTIAAVILMTACIAIIIKDLVLIIGIIMIMIEIAIVHVILSLTDSLTIEFHSNVLI